MGQTSTAWTKNYVERRGWLHPFSTFFRIYRFLFITFHIIVAIAALEDQLTDPNWKTHVTSMRKMRPFLSIGITIAIVNWLECVLGSWVMWEGTNWNCEFVIEAIFILTENMGYI